MRRQFPRLLASVNALMRFFDLGSVSRWVLFAALLCGANELKKLTPPAAIGAATQFISAAAVAGRFVPALRARPRFLAAAIVGGLAMGYGARLAFGCNIGAYFSGIASSSLHGWLWIAAALPGTWVGVKLRPLFGFRDEPA